MYTEISIRIKNQFPNDLKGELEKSIGVCADISNSIDLTEFKGQTDFSVRVKFAFISNDKVFLIFLDDSSSIRIHVQSSRNSTNLTSLNKLVEDTFNSIKRFLKDNHLEIENATASVFVESSYIIRGEYKTRKKVFIDLLKKDIPLKIYIPLVTFIVSLILGYEIEKILYNVLIAIGASVLWLVVETIRTKTELKYSLNNH